jgi:hypothetical protein
VPRAAARAADASAPNTIGSNLVTRLVDELYGIAAGAFFREPDREMRETAQLFRSSAGAHDGGFIQEGRRASPGEQLERCLDTAEIARLLSASIWI